MVPGAGRSKLERHAATLLNAVRERAAWRGAPLSGAAVSGRKPAKATAVTAPKETPAPGRRFGRLCPEESRPDGSRGLRWRTRPRGPAAKPCSRWPEKLCGPASARSKPAGCG